MTILVVLACLFILLPVGLPVAFAQGGIGLGMLICGGFSPLMAPQAILSTPDGFFSSGGTAVPADFDCTFQGCVGRDLFAAVQAWVGH